MAERHGWVSRKVAWQGRRGAMDRAFFGRGRCVFIEFKAPGEVPEGQQKREIARLAALYSDIHVVDSIAEACRILGLPHAR